MLMQSLGWLTVGAWTVICASVPGIIANIIIGITEFNHDNYVVKPWHTTLLMWGLIVVPFLFNLRFKQVLKVFELVAGIFHFVFFIVSIVTLAVLARRSTVGYVFNTLTTDQSGWTNPGICWSLGLLTSTYSITGT